VKIVAISQIIPIDTSTKIKEAKSIGGNVSQGSAIEIVEFYPKKDSYKVKLDLADGNNSYIDAKKAKELRTNKPLQYSNIEQKFFKNHT
jgi:hypothetical protein